MQAPSLVEAPMQVATDSKLDQLVTVVTVHLEETRAMAAQMNITKQLDEIILRQEHRGDAQQGLQDTLRGLNLDARDVALETAIAQFPATASSQADCRRIRGAASDQRRSRARDCGQLRPASSGAHERPTGCCGDAPFAPPLPSLGVGWVFSGSPEQLWGVGPRLPARTRRRPSCA